MGLAELEQERRLNPVDLIESVASDNDWSFERAGEDEIAMAVAGRWSNYHVSFSWMEDFEILHLACAFEVKMSQDQSGEIVKLLHLLNGQILMGHFDFWQGESMVIFRQSLLLAGGAEPTNGQVEVLFAEALATCERYFEAFHYITAGVMDAQAASEAAPFETVGQA